MALVGVTEAQEHGLVEGSGRSGLTLGVIASP